MKGSWRPLRVESQSIVAPLMATENSKAQLPAMQVLSAATTPATLTAIEREHTAIAAIAFALIPCVRSATRLKKIAVARTTAR
jgi:hypothetical protein